MDSESWPPPAPGSAVPRRVTATPVDDGAVIVGVARDLGVRTGIDPLWFRLAFVGLSAFSGLGVVLYIGTWMFLRGQRRSRVSWVSVLGVVVIVGGCIVLLGEAGTTYLDSPWTIVVLLAGATVALWQPRAAIVQVGERTAAADVGVPAPPPVADGRESRHRSYLGRVTLALALLVAAAGAIGYEIAGDGLHPERWLGAAAAVCGAGMVVGAWRGRALWLVVPGLLFAASGFVAGHVARAELDDFEVGSREFATASRTDALPAREHLAAGEIIVTIDDGPPPATRSDLRVGLGVIEIVVDEDVALEVRAHVHDGDIVVDGDERPSDGDPLVLRFGPNEPPDVIIGATISVGELQIDRREVIARTCVPEIPELPEVPEKPEVPED